MKGRIIMEVTPITLNNISERKSDEEQRNKVYDKSEMEHKFCLKDGLRPMLVTMAICGCYDFYQALTDYEEDANRPTTNRNAKRFAAKLYRILMLVVSLAILAKYIIAFFFISSDYILFNGMSTAWIITGLITNLLFVKATSAKYGHQDSAFKLWHQKIMVQFHDLHVEFPMDKIRRKLKIILIIALTVCTVQVTGSTIQASVSPENLDFYITPLKSGPVTLIMYVFMHTLFVLIWIVPTAHVIAIALIVRQTFRTYNTHFNSVCLGCTDMTKFQKLRILHLDLCSFVAELDKDLGWFYASLFVGSVGLACFALYQVIRMQMDTYVMILFLSWVVSCMGLLSLAAISAAFVHEAAHAPLETIYYMSVKDVDIERLAQINLFLSKLTGTQVGFTTCGLLTITKEFILTIAGVFLTYFAVLYTL